MDQDRQQLKELILDAERLMATARVEARALVSSAEIQAKELVDAARQLHAAAESESETIRSQAAEVRAAAEHQAQHLLDEAQQKQTAALDAARSIASSEQGHMDLVKVILDRYSIADPLTSNQVGVFPDPFFTMVFQFLTTKWRWSRPVAGLIRCSESPALRRKPTPMNSSNRHVVEQRRSMKTRDVVKRSQRNNTGRCC